jgi:hypothetical protein
MTIAPDSYVMIIGAMKSGTTSLYNYLIQHPRICSCKEKEPEFFSRQQDHGTKTHSYSDLWDFDPARHSYVLEASTGYTKFPFEKGVARRIADHGLRPRFIYCVRDPIDRILSQCRFVNNNPNWANIDAFADEAVYLSRYNEQLLKFTQLFRKEDILIVDFDLISTEPQAAADKVFQFLGLEGVMLDNTGVYNKTRAPGMLESNIRKKFPGVTKLFPESIRGFVKALSAKRSAEGQMEISGEERATLKELLRKDIVAFGDKFDFDVSKWGF